MSTNTTSVWRKKLKELEIVVVIPTYNNGKTLAAVIEEVCRYADDIIVVNDGSTDDTANILEQYPAIRTITHPVNKGKGTALKHGLSQAKKEGFRYAITIDSDGQHFASDIPCFIEAIEKEPDTLCRMGRCSGEEHSHPRVLSPASRTGIPFPAVPGFYPYQCAEHGAGADYLPLDCSP